MKKVFDRLLEYNLKLKLKKYQFRCDSIKFLEHEISNKGVSVHKDHFDPIKYLKTPTTKKRGQKVFGDSLLFQSICPITKILRNNV